MVGVPPFEKYPHRTPGDVSEVLIATLEAVPTFAFYTVRVTPVGRLSHSDADLQSTVGEINPPGCRSQGSSYIRGPPPTLRPTRTGQQASSADNSITTHTHEFTHH